MSRLWKGIVLLLLLASLVSTWIQVAGIQRWIGVGGRFTDLDGQLLCERVKALEITSYGYHDAGHKSHECNYIKK
jgi:hypothetical protein